MSKIAKALTAAAGNVPAAAVEAYGSLSFDGPYSGSPEYLVSGASTDISSIGTGNFTSEAWIKIPNNATLPLGGILSTRQDASASSSQFFFGLNGRVLLYYAGVSVQTTEQINIGTWTHVAAVRDSGTITIYIDGRVAATGADSATKNTNQAFVACGGGAGSQLTDVIISNARLSNIARYNTAFTPPSVPFVSDNFTLFLTCQSGSLTTDNGKNSLPITVVGSPTENKDYPEDPRYYNITGISPTANLQTSFSSQATSIAGGCFGNNGTVLFINSYTAQDVIQLNLSTPYDTSTFTNPSKVKFLSDSGSIRCMQFNPEGTKLFLASQSTSTIKEYALSIPWDASSLSSTATTSISGQGGNDCGVFITDDGTKLFSVNFAGSLRKWDLSIPWTLSSASVSQTVNLAGVDSSGRDIIFSPDGTEMIYFGSQFDSIYAFDLTTPWDISTIDSVRDSFDPVSVSVPITLATDKEGNRLILGDNTSSAFETFKMTADKGVILGDYSLYADHGTSFGGAYSMSFNYDGTKMYVDSSYSSNATTLPALKQFSLSTPYDISTATVDGALFPTWSSVYPFSYHQWIPDGSGMFVNSYGTNDIKHISFSTPWDVTSGYSIVSSKSGVYSSNAAGLLLSSDGRKMYVTKRNSNVYEYTLSTPWVLSSAGSETIRSGFSGGYGMIFIDDYILIGSRSSNIVYLTKLGTPEDLTTAQTTTSLNFGYSNFGLHYSKSGDRLYLLQGSGSAGKLVEFRL